MVARRPPTKRSAKASIRRGFNPTTSPIPGGGPRLPKPAGLDPLAKAALASPPLGSPSAGGAAFTPPPRPLNMPNMGNTASVGTMGGGHASNKRNPLGKGGAGSEASDAAKDKKRGIKEGSKKDLALDKKAGLKSDVGAGQAKRRKR